MRMTQSQKWSQEAKRREWGKNENEYEHEFKNDGNEGNDAPLFRYSNCVTPPQLAIRRPQTAATGAYSSTQSCPLALLCAHLTVTHENLSLLAWSFEYELRVVKFKVWALKFEVCDRHALEILNSKANLRDEIC